MYCSGKKKRHTVKTQLMVNNRGYIIHKIQPIKKEKDMIMMFIKRTIQSFQKVLNIFDLGYVGVETDFPEQLSVLPNRKEEKSGTITSRKRV